MLVCTLQTGPVTESSEGADWAVGQVFGVPGVQGLHHQPAPEAGQRQPAALAAHAVLGVVVPHPPARHPLH